MPPDVGVPVPTQDSTITGDGVSVIDDDELMVSLEIEECDECDEIEDPLLGLDNEDNDVAEILD